MPNFLGRASVIANNILEVSESETFTDLTDDYSAFYQYDINVFSAIFDKDLNITAYGSCEMYDNNDIFDSNGMVSFIMSDYTVDVATHVLFHIFRNTSEFGEIRQYNLQTGVKDLYTPPSRYILPFMYQGLFFLEFINAGADINLYTTQRTGSFPFTFTSFFIGTITHSETVDPETVSLNSIIYDPTLGGYYCIITIDTETYKLEFFGSSTSGKNANDFPAYDYVYNDTLLIGPSPIYVNSLVAIADAGTESFSALWPSAFGNEHPKYMQLNALKNEIMIYHDHQVKHDSVYPGGETVFREFTAPYYPETSIYPGLVILGIPALA